MDSREANLKISCNLFGPAGIVRRIFKKFRDDIWRIKVDRIFYGEMSKFLEIWPTLSEENRRQIGEQFRTFLDKNPDISFQEYKAIVVLIPLCIGVIYPKITEESVQTLFKLVFEEVRDRGKMFDKL